ncbi:MAG: Rid family hydrolase [Longimicrobiales bacterium]|nr:Rid family hydrolase [Longimicrobiales bacterium]
MKIVSTPDGPTPAGHYSQAVVYGGVVYVAGMFGKDPATPDTPLGGAGEQTRTALRNVSTVLEAAGSSLTSIIRMTVYVSDIDYWGEVNEAYAEVMGDHKPARAIVAVKNFPDPYIVEIVATAALGG